MKIVIMAGGKGTRISSMRSDVPKPMIDLLGKPVLQHQIEFFRNNGYNEFIIVVGYKAEIIKDYFCDGKDFGVNIKYYTENEPLGTAGALKYLKEDLNDDFFLVNADIIFNIDIDRFFKFHKEKKAVVTIATHPNNHPYDSSLIFTDDNKNVTKWIVKEDDRTNLFGNRVNSGIHIISPKIFYLLENIKNLKIDLDRDVFRKILDCNKLFAYDTPEYIHDMGTPERYERTVLDLKNNLPFIKNLKNKQRAIFLDRDGTINKYKGFINKHQDIELIEGVPEAIKTINNSEYLAIVITNQPVIARGECTFEELEKIHDKLKYLLGCSQAYVDDILYCPHHPDSGFEGEIKELKINCNCRKPNNGLILKAVEKYNIDLSKSYMIGDSLIDIECGENSGCTSFLISNDKYERISTVNSFKEGIEKILCSNGRGKN